MAGPARTDPATRPRHRRQPAVWEELDSRLTPNDEFFTVKHYELPQLTAPGYRLAVDGLVAPPRSFSLAALRARQPRHRQRR